MPDPIADPRLQPPTVVAPAGRAAILRWVGLAVSLVAVILVVRSVDVAAAFDTLRRASLGPLLVAVAIVPIQVLFVTARWRWLLPHRPDGRPPAYVETLRAVYAGYLGNLALPARLGEAVRAYVIARRQTLDLPETLGTTVLERVIDTSTLAILAWLVSTIVPLPGWLVGIIQLIAIAGAIVLGLLVTIGLSPFVRVAERVAVRLSIRDAAHRVLHIIDRLASGASATRRRPAVAIAIVISCFSWALEAAIFLLVAESLSTELSPGQAFLIAAVSVLVTAVPSAPGYVGTYELAAVATATSLGIPQDQALAIAILAHAVTVLPLAVGGLWAVASLGRGIRPLAIEASVAEGASLASDDEPAASEGQPAANEGQPVANEGQPTATERQPAVRWADGS